ncbi:MAG: hypothetical protein HC837_19620 [Chloroflexaceae bacterium]|nr:hypothetical protein [Chloroflexaceae bacterium]
MTGSDPGLRMVTRDTTATTAPLRTSALENGSWYEPAIYDSTLPGPDGDHWFTVDLRSGPGQSNQQVTLPLTPTMPFASGPMVLTLTGSAYTSATHQLQISTGGAAEVITWQGIGDWSQTISFPAAAQIDISTIAGAAPSGVLLDHITWQRPVTLHAAGGNITFSGVSGTWRYQLSGAATESTLYAITSASTPQRLSTTAANLVFEDGPDAQTYLLTTPDTLVTPAVQAHTPLNLALPLNAQVIYIAPADFQAALQPLVDLRRQQGYTVAVVTIQSIYDAWSDGQVAPDAIRAFLRYAASTWNPAPQAVTLVGDGTSDPRNYSQLNHTHIIPPYLAMVDPWLGETACETCYAQLDGDDPLADPMPDLHLGRLPVKSASELTALVSKIVGYETNDTPGPWRSQAVFLADNFLDAQGQPDDAGDFAAAAESAIALQPDGMTITRVYYDPSPEQPTAPWGQSDAMQAHQSTLDALQTGAGTVVFHGHSHYWQWASTDLQAEKPYLLGLFDPNKLTNGERLPIVLAMTCLSSSFHQPAISGTTIDERMVLQPNGGAVALWGPTGLGVAYGHDLLQHGFYHTLWHRPSIAPYLGNLVQAGYLELFTQGSCCQNTIQTFVLLGDPLTQAQVSVTRHIFLPMVQR